jgi:hypothetical protein
VSSGLGLCSSPLRLAVAPHTHCGRIALRTPGCSYIGLTDEKAVVADGFAPADYGATGNRLFVTCGMGSSLTPVRIYARLQHKAEVAAALT